MLDIFIMLHIIIYFCTLLFTWPFLCFTWSIIPCLHDLFYKCFEIPVLMSVFCVAVGTAIWVSNYLLPGSWTVAIPWKMNLLSVLFRPYTTSLLCPGALIPYSIFLLWDSNNTDNKNRAVLHLQCSAQPSIFFHLLLTPSPKHLFFHNSIIFLICAAAVAESFFLLLDINEWNTSFCVQLWKEIEDFYCYVALKCSKLTPSVDTDLLPPFNSDWIWCANLATTRSA